MFANELQEERQRLHRETEQFNREREQWQAEFDKTFQEAWRNVQGLLHPLANPGKRDEALRVLGLNPTATAEQIKTAYRKLAMAHHPDRHGDEAEFRRMQAAYETLSR